MPYRVTGDGQEILLITSLATRRWIIPKGNIDTHMSPHQAAAQEALEEAGVVGEIDHNPLGVFRYPKLITSGATLTAKVVVFPLAVGRELDDWPERDIRERYWFSQTEAADAVREPGLQAIIRSFRQ